MIVGLFALEVLLLLASFVAKEAGVGVVVVVVVVFEKGRVFSSEVD